MRSRRAGLLELLLMTVAATGTTWLATLAWRGFTRDPGSYLVPLLLVALLVSASGAALRWLRAPVPLIVLGQVLVSGMGVSALLTGSLLPFGEAGVRLLSEISTAVDGAQQYRAPVPAEAAIAPLLILGGWACMLLVDVFASTLRRVSLAGLPLLAIYSIPVSMLGGGVAWWAFALASGGFLFMLYLQHSDAITRWGRALEERHGTYGGRAPAVRAGAAGVGAAALGLAVFMPILIPTLSLSVFGFGPGDGPGSGIAVDNPMTDLRRDLLRTEDVDLLRVTTDDPEPGYLRIAALNRFNDNEWSTGDRDIPLDQRAEGAVPSLADVDADIARTERTYEVTALSEFESRWLPTQYPVNRISAEGDWRYDTTTFDFLASDEDDLDTAGLTYSFTEVELDLQAEELADAPSGAADVDSSFRELPDDFPTFVDNLAIEVTRDYSSRYEKAVALQDWFREDGGFEYSLDNVQPGNGSDRLVEFLTEGEGGRTGYCEQFASAMAAMARSLGIPARVAVGFLTPTADGPGSFVYSSDDLHAWPELYFSGAGWVRFEPTPPDRASGVPSYTAQQLPQAPEIDPSAQPSGSAAPSQSQGADPRLDEGALPEDQSPTAGQGFPLAQVLWSLAGVLLVVTLVLLPRIVRQRQETSRLTGEPELAWAELHATAIDLGVPWPVDRSPRETRDLLVPQLASTDPEDDDLVRPRRGAEASPEGVAALDRLVLALERLRYSQGAWSGDADVVVEDARTVAAALVAGATPGTRRRARWWPSSVVRWRRHRWTAPTQGTVLVRRSGVVDHVG
ncbi:DUF3488 and transglutaminase-like domain-containing protein [Nocardioides euryhalodurans]|uniref:Transglutaminase-like domain-containing protein n=1 Tax=Nocardioides euryhalodurans TaxID=2518370 RepID=A0A4P7GG72_9ACTN|nr:DUF3488 and transglutaminase-like domain-containing protein [Nocardioides euryhalodurans]QBR90840.1 hypothetical protein EXE57_00065 [Nocardioides euryhalodurans]